MNIFTVIIATCDDNRFVKVKQYVETLCQQHHVLCFIYHLKKLYYQLPSYLRYCDCMVVDNHMPVIGQENYIQYIKSHTIGIVIHRYNRQCFHVIEKEIKNKKEKQYLSFRYLETIYRLDFESIGYIEASKHYTYLHTSYGCIVCPLSLSYMLETLTYPFIRIHRSYIVNLHHVTIDKGHVTFLDGTQLKITKSYQNIIKKQR